METPNSPAKQGLFSALARHEVAHTEGNTIEPSQGLRPRLPNRFEMIDANMDTPPFEEQHSETSISSPNSGFSKNTQEEVGLHAVKSSFPQENASKPEDKFQYLALSPEPERALRRSNDRIPEAEPQFRGIWTEGHEDKLASGITGFKPPSQDSLQPSSAIKVPQEKTIIEKLTTVEREILREIHSSKPSLPTSDRQTGLTPRMQPVQALKSPTVEKTTPPNIEIHIGKIEVRAQIQASPPKQEKISAPARNDVALQAYLQSRSRGARS